MSYRFSDASALKQWRYVIDDYDIGHPDPVGSHIDTIIRRVRKGKVTYHTYEGTFPSFHTALVAVYQANEGDKA